MNDNTLLHIEALARERFPAFAGIPLSLEPLEKGGSDRNFYRIHARNLAPIIFVQYGHQKEENKHYVEIGAFLENAGVRVPKMFLHEPVEGRIWMEDLGAEDLWTSRHEPWEIRRPLYEATLCEVFRLHQSADRFPEAANKLELQPPFDAALYHWEQEYFFKHCVSRHFGIDLACIADSRSRLHQIALELENLPRCLVHRDFQSQNIIVQQDVPCLIDFQGMRFGLPQYDLASLFLDPYVALTESEQAALMTFYLFLLKTNGVDISPDFERIYWLCAGQRLMQALGAYGFLGHEKNRQSFLSHIPVAIPRLLHVFKRIGGLDPLIALIEGAVCNETLRKYPVESKKAAHSC